MKRFLLLCACAKTSLANHIAAFMFEECRSNNLRRAGCSIVNQNVSRNPICAVRGA